VFGLEGPRLFVGHKVGVRYPSLITKNPAFVMDRRKMRFEAIILREIVQIPPLDIADVGRLYGRTRLVVFSLLLQEAPSERGTALIRTSTIDQGLFVNC
jgi:hypothetical protein